MRAYEMGAMGHKPRAADTLPRIVSLFSGAGGLDLGFAQQGFEVPFATDHSEAAKRTHSRNFPGTDFRLLDLAALEAHRVVAEVKKIVPRRTRIGVIGGPPCQGFSRANVRASSRDPRNALPGRYLAIVGNLQKHYVVDFVVFENVLGIRDKKHARTFKSLLKGLESLGFGVSVSELCALDFGVPQTRRRIFVIGTRQEIQTPIILSTVSTPLTVGDAIRDLPTPVFFARGLDPKLFGMHPNHWTMKPKSKRFAQTGGAMQSTRSFKRLIWDRPSPTIAFGHREIHVHPDGTRRLSIFEAMQLQGFPSTFVLEGNLSEQAEQVSNAVPPPLARAVAKSLQVALANSK